jgi:hypothetical protein
MGASVQPFLMFEGRGEQDGGGGNGHKLAAARAA